MLVHVPVVDEADLYGAVSPELGSVVDAAHAAHRDVPPDVQLLLEDVAHLAEINLTYSYYCQTWYFSQAFVQRRRTSMHQVLRESRPALTRSSARSRNFFIS